MVLQNQTETRYGAAKHMSSITLGVKLVVSTRRVPRPKRRDTKPGSIFIYRLEVWPLLGVRTPICWTPIPSSVPTSKETEASAVWRLSIVRVFSLWLF